ncbi:uncharacterized protein TNCV_483241 [Trichonephila clavipes]|uniref:Uncharacterized protein n=1 Tax=Trichonephila clavipes TaxID=2585209 RepID=A0A8X6V1A3_TRICX|nr:uncharacterized protein TNCV_483241 [Trichonephila clavipes]
MAPPTSCLKSIKGRLVSTLLISYLSSTSKQIDAFFEQISTPVVSLTLPEKPDALEYAARQGQIRACIIYQEPNIKRVFVLFCKDNCPKKKKNRWRTISSVPQWRCRANPNLFRRRPDALSSNGVWYPIPAGTRYILLTVQKTVFGLNVIPETILSQLIENGFNLGDFRKIKRYDHKAYKLPPPTPAHVPSETSKRPLEETPGPSFKRLRSTVSQTPAHILLPDPPVSQTPAHILLPDPPVSQTPAHILLPDPPVSQTPAHILLPDPPVSQSPVQFLLLDPPVSQPPVQFLLLDPPVSQPPVQIQVPDPPVVETLELTLTNDF